MCRLLLIRVFALLLLTAGLRADLPVPPRVLDPQTAAEAWNVIHLVVSNVTRLLREQRLDEVPQQISLCSPALRALARFSVTAEHQQRVNTGTVAAFRLINDISQSSKARLQQVSENSFARLRSALDDLQPAFMAEDVRREIYICPQHPDFLTTQASTPCRICGGPQRVRRIPYTDVNPTPEVPQVTLNVEGTGTLVAGAPATLAFRLQNRAGQPMEAGRLVPFHAEPVRLLVADAALADFHLITPSSSPRPGSFTATFTPATSGPYRAWAELVPEETGIPEYPAADLGGEFKAVDLSRHAFVEALEATSAGLHFQLSFAGANGGQPNARQVSTLRLQITDAASGQPVTRLEPLMNAFAHLTGIYADCQTLLRLHPTGGDILREDLRGGPSLAFRIYPPKPGFIRFFCQVRVDGRIVTVPLGVQVVP